MPQQNCFHIDDDMGMGEATISEPLAIGIYAVRRSGLARGQRIGILGMGPIGRTVLMPARLEGCAAAYCTDKIDERCAAADRAGATWVGNPLREDVVARILAAEPDGLDVVFECCGEQEALDQAVELLKPGGKLMIIGIPEVDQIVVQPHKMRSREATTMNVRRQCGCVEAALDMVAQRQVEVDALITHRFPFAETKAAFDTVAGYHDGVVKAMIEFE